jgi:RNA polymerase sigma-70 factor, ECF subfamily
MLDDSQHSLLERLQRGDNAAYHELVTTHGARLHHVAVRLLGDNDDAAEIVQETFVAAWRGIATFDGRAALPTWLHRITVNAALMRLRQRTRRHEVSIEDVAPVKPRRDAMHNTEYGTESDDALAIDPEVVIDDPIERDEASRTIWAAVDTLGEDYRTILILRDVEELPSKEVAAQLGLSDATVRQKLHRARQAVAVRLRASLRDLPPLTCGGALDLLFDHLDDVLAGDLRTHVANHVASCGTCGPLSVTYQLAIAAPRHWALRASTERTTAVLSSILRVGPNSRG